MRNIPVRLTSKNLLFKLLYGGAIYCYKGDKRVKFVSFVLHIIQEFIIYANNLFHDKSHELKCRLHFLSVFI